MYPPGKHEAHQRADEDHHLVEHGGVGSLDGPVEVVLHGGRDTRGAGNEITVNVLHVFSVTVAHGWLLSSKALARPIGSS